MELIKLLCGVSFSPDHAMICRHGRMTFIRHNEIRDVTVEWLNHDVVVEPPLQSLTGENIVPAIANRQDDDHADIHARGFWVTGKVSFLM